MFCLIYKINGLIVIFALPPIKSSQSNRMKSIGALLAVLTISVMHTAAQTKPLNSWFYDYTSLKSGE